MQDINCFNPQRHVQTSTNNFKNLKSKASDAVIPARYKITSTKNYENPSTTQSFPEFFPEVEYPESVVESSKPFYISTSPFPNDVKSTFNSLVAKEKSKAKTVTDYSLTQNEKSKEKIPVPSQTVAEKEITATKGNEINTNDKDTNETLVEDIKKVDIEDDTVNDEIPHSDNDVDRLFTNWTSVEQSDESKETDYVVRLLNDLTGVMKNLASVESKIIEAEDKAMKNLTGAETLECDEGGYNSMEAFESESDIFGVTPDMTLNNNDSIIELNGNSDFIDEHPEPIWNPLFEDSDTNDTLTSFDSLFNDYIMNATSVEDMQSDFCSIGTVANETDISCTKS